MTSLAPVIFGLEGVTLTERETALFTQVRPVGYILFTRNCDTPAQLSELTASLKALHTDYQPLILIDQEGGRVARLRAPYWEAPPPPGDFADMVGTQGLDAACNATCNNSIQIAQALSRHGINVNCMPMADIRFAHSHDIIGDRAYGTTPDQVIALARAAADGLLRHSVLPVLKHLPGHGRATADSHETLPVVDASRTELETDFAPFRALADLPLGMTAHIRYTALDAELPATLSPTMIRLIREDIGFTNPLMTDDLCMKALDGTPGELACRSLDAGCDLVLHCNGDINAMEQIAASLDKGGYAPFTLERLDSIYSTLSGTS